MPTSKYFAWINFRKLPGLKNFAWIYFREDRDFDQYFLPKKEMPNLAFVQRFRCRILRLYKDSDWLSLIMNKKICLLPISRFFSWSLGSFKKYVGSEVAIWRKANSHCLMMYFIRLFKICEKGEEGGENWENSKACTFWITPYQFQASPMNFLNLFRVD